MWNQCVLCCYLPCSIFLPAAVRWVWFYLCGVTLWSTWTETGKSPHLRWLPPTIPWDTDNPADPLTLCIPLCLIKLFSFCNNYTLSLFLHSGFSVSTVSRVHVFKPVSVQAMWWESLFSNVRITFSYVALWPTAFYLCRCFISLLSFLSVFVSYSCTGCICCISHICPLHPLVDCSSILWVMKETLSSLCFCPVRQPLKCESSSYSSHCQVSPAVASQSMRGGSLP